jgi:hypothetical protein
VFFDLHIRMPVGALTSITHRVTGVLMAIGVPFAIYLSKHRFAGRYNAYRSVGTAAGAFASNRLNR